MPPIASGKTIIYKSNCNLNPVATLLDLPLVGAENTLYIVKDTAAIYIWDGADYIVYDSRPYKSYVALVGQEDADDPTATVYENTTGYTVTWTRDQIGQYIGTFVGAPVDIDGKVFDITPINSNTKLEFDELTYNASGYNSVSMAISLEGGCEYKNGKLLPKDNFTPIQIQRLEELIAKYKKQIPNLQILPHNAVNKGKACPVLDIKKLKI